jgi:hypothetical protein
METLLDWLKLRNFLIAGGVVAFVVLADRFQEYPRGWYEARQVARDRGGDSRLAAAISDDLETRESSRLKALHRAVSDEIAAAQAKGLKVDHLQEIADKALGLDSPKYRHAAMERLNQLRLAIPLAQESVRPAGEGDENADEPAAPKNPRARRARAK